MVMIDSDDSGGNSNPNAFLSISRTRQGCYRIKSNYGYIRLLVLVSLAILLYMFHLLAFIAKPTIAFYKASFGNDKGHLDFLGV